MRDDAQVQNSSARADETPRPALRPFGEAAAIGLQHARAMMSSPIYWPIVLTASVLCATTGPFDTFEALTLFERSIFWIPIVVGDVLTFTVVAFFIRALDNREVTRWYVRAAVTATIGVLPAALLSFVMALLVNLYVTPPKGNLLAVTWLALPPIYCLTFLVYFIIRQNEEREEAAIRQANEKMARFRMTQAQAQAKAQAQAQAQAAFGTRNNTSTTVVTDGPKPQFSQSRTPASAHWARGDLPSKHGIKAPGALLFERLPPELGTDIVTLQAQNHHTIVTTQLGTARVLMRIGDAEADLAGLPCGMRVHRSWWVNLAHVVGISPRGASIELTLDSGAVIPVGRGQRAPVREAVEELTDRGA